MIGAGKGDLAPVLCPIPIPFLPVPARDHALFPYFCTAPLKRGAFSYI